MSVIVAQGLSVLIVEDHLFQRRTLARMLRSLGAHQVVEAGDGKEALELLELMRGAKSADLIICDLDMPEMDGMEFIRHLGQEHSGASVIISSAKERALLASVGKMAFAYGVRLLGLIEKPVTLAGLENLISKHAPQDRQPDRVTVTAPKYSLDQILHGLRQKQFEPFFQPKVDFATGQVIGAEALARWRHPVDGWVSPYAFIETLESSGNIDELTFQMLEMAAQACRGWQAHGYELTVSVNLSLVSLNDTTLAGQITQIVRSAGLDPYLMMLEITESAVMSEVAAALENLTRLRMRGFGLSVDDYGTGFSSLQQLSRVPFTELKIDQSFVADCDVNRSSRVIVESSVEMARQLGIKSVAEGVETQAVWDILKAMHCDVAQGYFIGKPMEDEQFIVFCDNNVLN